MTGKVDDRGGYPKGTGSRVIYEAVQQRILGLKLRPGQSIDEQKLIDEFGVSRTPVREALIWLAADGTVEVVPNRGAWVARLREEEIPEILEALELCLRMTHRWAAERHAQADIGRLSKLEEAARRAWASGRVTAVAQGENRLLEGVAGATRNRFMVEAFDTILPSFLRLSYALLSLERRTAGRLGSIGEQCGRIHRDSIAAIASRDVGRADDVARRYTTLLASRVGVLLPEAAD